MSTQYEYPDAYLARFCVADREDRAVAHVAQLAMSAGVTLSPYWLEQTTVVQTYVLAALENQADADDLFAQKLKHYRQRFDVLLPQGIAAAQAEAGTVGGLTLFSIPLERA